MIGYIVAGVIAIILVVVIVLYIFMKSTGKITINLIKFDFTEGDTISGIINLKLKKPVEAKSLSIKLIGEKTNTNYSKTGSKSSTQNIFELVKQIDGEKMYMVGEQNYNFDLKIPMNIKQTTGSQIADTLVKSMQILSGQNSKIDWYLIAYLDMKGFNISKRVRIYIN